MDLGAAARRAGSVLAGGDTVERTAALASATVVGTSFGPGLLPRPGLDQALATGIVAATNHGLVMTSQSACEALARRLVNDDGTPSGRYRARRVADLPLPHPRRGRSGPARARHGPADRSGGRWRRRGRTAAAP